MSIMFFKVRSVSRAKGGNAVAKSAYISREKIVDHRNNQAHDYQRTPGLQHSEIFVPGTLSQQAREWAADRTQLWNAAEAAERRVNSRVGREYTIALPHELGPEVRRELARDFARGISDRYGVAVDLAVHGPTRRGDPRNHHMHVLASTRELTEDGFGAKATMELSSDRRRMLGLSHVTVEYKDLRKMWAGLANERLLEAAVDQRLEPRSRASLMRSAAENAAEMALQTDGDSSLVAVQRRGVDRWLALRQERELGQSQGRSVGRDLVRNLDNALEL